LFSHGWFTSTVMFFALVSVFIHSCKIVADFLVWLLLRDPPNRYSTAEVRQDFTIFSQPSMALSTLMPHTGQSVATDR
jgi:hypothetical protein